jgi:hypothetical protein
VGWATFWTIFSGHPVEMSNFFEAKFEALLSSVLCFKKMGGRQVRNLFFPTSNIAIFKLLKPYTLAGFEPTVKFFSRIECD